LRRGYWGTFGPKRDKVKGEWRKLHNDELNNVYFSPNTSRLIKSRGMRWNGHVACMGKDKFIQCFGEET